MLNSIIVIEQIYILKVENFSSHVHLVYNAPVCTVCGK